MSNEIIAVIKGMNVFGMGSEPIAIAIAAFITIFICQKSIKERDYEHAMILFAINWTMMMIIGISGTVYILAVYYFVVLFGVFFTGSPPERVAHTISSSK